jgi:CPA2 family monovalent cation:H+ antiporter-2
MTIDAGFRFLTDLTVALGIAAAAGFVASRLRLNPIVGYLVAGIIVGPFTPGYVAQQSTLHDLADLGLIFLLFSIGLGVSFREMLAVGPRAIVLAVAAIGASIGAAALALHAAHVPDALELGMIAAVSSTAIGIALLQQWKILERPSGRLMLALLIVQDLVSVVLLVIVGEPAGHLSIAIVAVALLKAVGFVAISLILGATLLHRVVQRLLRTVSTEGLFPAFAALALVAACLAKWVGLSVEFGAFVAGAVISEAAGSGMVQSIIAPFRAVFVALFFVSIGMVIDPQVIFKYWPAVAIASAAFGVFRLLLWGGVARLSGFSLRTSALVGLGLLSLGEFNLALAQMGIASGRVNDVERSIFLGVVFISIFVAMLIAPFATRLRGTYAGERVRPKSEPAQTPRAEVLVVGYGRVGKTVATALRRLGVNVAVLELEHAAARGARGDGIATVTGSAADPIALDALVDAHTRVVVVTTPSTDTNASVADRVNALSHAAVIARATKAPDVARLSKHGVTQAFVPETEGAFALARAALRELKFSDERIDGVIGQLRSE